MPTDTHATTTPTDTAAPPSEPGSLDAIVDGGFGKMLGLEHAHLMIGLEIAIGLRMRGALAEALRMHATLVLAAPTDVELQIGLAECALMVEAYEIALQAASVVVAVAPSDPRGYLLSGRACLGLDALEEAREDLADAVRFASAAGRADILAEARRLSARFD
ncbi:hypothetical protein [Chthonobacter rhizosphaerae]|uniref:hypothetical protein n=1 Tax=Chthonobacter rhizosphaerae TaxID=2735553 RepID=UPI0015EEA15C|nr:hypothetical protein [Chthonobacter rhizosphaerae]